jgi:hypothetical protein
MLAPSPPNNLPHWHRHPLSTTATTTLLPLRPLYPHVYQSPPPIAAAAAVVLPLL